MIEMRATREALLHTVEPESATEYLVSRTDHLVFIYQKYMRMVGLGNTRVYRYEDVIFKKREWANDICSYFEISADSEQLSRIADQHDIFPDKESPDQHIRQVISGNHRRYFSERTNQWLKDRFREIDDFFGFSNVISTEY